MVVYIIINTIEQIQEKGGIFLYLFQERTNCLFTVKLRIRKKVNKKNTTFYLLIPVTFTIDNKKNQLTVAYTYNILLI